MFGRKRALRKKLRRSFVVTKVDGSMFQGALIEEDPEWLSFTFVRVPDPQHEGQWVKAAEGQLLIHVGRIDYMQQLNIVDVAGGQ